MPRIALITTGDLEFMALGTSLKQIFPEAEFEPQRTDSFTSSRVVYPPDDPKRPQTKAEEMAALLIAAVDRGKGKDRADFAIAIDDLELCNLDQPDVVVDVFHQAVARYLEHSWPSLKRREKAYQTASDCCSFHLFVPMLEAYFFGDANALQKAGAKLTPQLQAGGDREAFSVVDQSYLDSASDEQREHWRQHPKQYLKYLTGKAYRETKHGNAALVNLDWKSVLDMQHKVKYLRSLFTDIAEMLDRSSPFSGNTAPLTWNRDNPARLLRNIGPK